MVVPVDEEVDGVRPQPGDDDWEISHDRRTPTPAETLRRAVRFASESVRGIDMQCRRIAGTEPEDEEWLFRQWMDFQLLVVCLWRLRLAGRMAARVVQPLDVAVAAFDAVLPDLQTMRHVAQHLDDYAVDAPQRRQRRPDTNVVVGRRSLEVGAWSTTRFEWLGGAIDVRQAQEAARDLYGAICARRDQAESEDLPG